MNDKRILCSNESSSCEGYILARDHYRNDSAFLGGLAVEATKDFPELDVKTIQTFKVTASRYNLGFWGIVFPLPAGSKHAAYRPVSCLDFCATCIDHPHIGLGSPVNTKPHPNWLKPALAKFRKLTGNSQ